MIEKQQTLVGKPVDRVDGHLKVTGQAKYSAEYFLPKLAYAVLIQSTITKGKIRNFDSREAERLKGVIKIISYKNAGAIPPKPTKGFDDSLHLLQNPEIHYDRQIIGIVVAETYEIASEAASLVRVSYDKEPAQVSMDKSMSKAKAPSDKSDWRLERGDFKKAASEAELKVHATYITPSEIHSPMEPHATTALWTGDKLEVWESTQAIFNTRNKLAKAFGIPARKVRVIAKFLGGGFGTKLSTWTGTVLCALAARVCQRPVRLALSRQNTFGGTGFRPRTQQTLTLAASKSGKLKGIKHECINESSSFQDFVEDGTDISTRLYACPNVLTISKIVPVDIGKPTWMRAPGEAPGAFALECAMDELAYEAGIDPIELRLINYAENDGRENLPWSSKALKACYEQAAKRFGWEKRKPKPGSMKKDGLLMGWGMASGMHPYYRLKASAGLSLKQDGRVSIFCGTQDIGTGTYTIMSQIASDALALPLDKISFELGDTTMPEAPLSGGSMTAATAGNAVHAVCLEALAQLKELAVNDKRSPLFGLAAADMIARDEGLYHVSDSKKGESYASILKRSGKKSLDCKASSEGGADLAKYSKYSFAAHLAEVTVDPELGIIRVTRFVSAVAAGKIINPKTAASQIKGGIIYGIGMALTEELIRDEQSGRIVNADLAEYHVPVHADVPNLDLQFVDDEDNIINPLGVKGVGEVAIIGVAPAIANAVYHACGKRVRDLPITLDKII